MTVSISLRRFLGFHLRYEWKFVICIIISGPSVTRICLHTWTNMLLYSYIWFELEAKYQVYLVQNFLGNIDVPKMLCSGSIITWFTWLKHVNFFFFAQFKTCKLNVHVLVVMLAMIWNKVMSSKGTWCWILLMARLFLVVLYFEPLCMKEETYEKRHWV